MTAYRYESKLYEKGYNYIAGVDEAGRGPLAGPVVAAAVILKKGVVLKHVNDSKKLSEKQRNRARIEIDQKAIAIGVSFISELEIDEINIYEASKKAMIKAIEQLKIKPDYLLIDAMKLKIEIDSSSIIKGDSLSVSIAAASIIAKTTRDEYMTRMHELYPNYKFKNNKGYGTKAHLEALDRFGPCPIHRMTFKPVSSMIK